MPCSIAWCTTPIGSNSPVRACASAKRLSRSLDLLRHDHDHPSRPAGRRRPGRLQIGMVAGFTSEQWPASDRKPRPASSEYAAWARAGAGPLVTPALAQAALAQTEPAPVQPQPEKPDHPRPRAGDPTTTPAPPPPLSPETKALRSKLEASKLDLDQKEAALNRRELSDAELQAMRQGIDPIAESLRALVADLTPKRDAAKARLDQLGPKPKEDDPDEGADVAHDRAEREAAAGE